MNNPAIVNVTVTHRTNKAQVALEQMLQLVDRDWPQDFEGDYKDCAVETENLLWSAAEELGHEFEVLVDACSCPRSWQVKVTVGKDKAVFPQR